MNCHLKRLSYFSDVGACEYIMEQKKEARFIEQLRAERNIIEGKDLKEAVGFIEDTIISQNSFSACLRLLCLLSLTHDGLPVKEYRNFVKLFLQ